MKAGEHVRQGDILLVYRGKNKPKVEDHRGRDRFDPQKCERRNIVAEGEVTGHHHALSDGATAYVIDSRMFIQSVKAEASIVHDEHEAIPLEEGWWEVFRQQEYREESWKFVRD